MEYSWARVALKTKTTAAHADIRREILKSGLGVESTETFHMYKRKEICQSDIEAALKNEQMILWLS